MTRPWPTEWRCFHGTYGTSHIIECPWGRAGPCEAGEHVVVPVSAVSERIWWCSRYGVMDDKPEDDCCRRSVHALPRPCGWRWVLDPKEDTDDE